MIGIRRKDSRTEDEKPGVTENIPPTESPQWTDPLRGILIALVEQHKILWDISLKPTKQNRLDRWHEISQLLQNQDKRMTVFSVLEKWCWMVEMNARSESSVNWKWRYSSVMSFLNNNPENSLPYLGCLSQERFSLLSKLYAVEDEEKLAGDAILPKYKKRNSAQPLFLEELMFLEMPGKNPETAGNLNEGGISTRASGKLLSTTNTTVTRRGRPKRGKANMDSPIFKNQSGKGKESARGVANLELKLATTPKFNIETVATLLGNISNIKGEVEETIPSPQTDLAHSSASNQSHSLPSDSCKLNEGNRVEQWTPELVQALIEAVKEYPALWHSAHPLFRSSVKRREFLGNIAEILRKLPGGSHINEDHVSGKWSLLRECFNKQHKKVRSNGNTTWEYYESMVFLIPQVQNVRGFDDIIEPEVEKTLSSPGSSTINLLNTTSPTTTASVTAITSISPCIPSVSNSSDTNDVGSYLKRMLGLQSNNSEDHDISKKQKLDSSLLSRQNNAKKNNATAISTWVPPKEDSVAAAMQCLMSHEFAPKPTATAQITASKTISPNLLDSTMKTHDTDFASSTIPVQVSEILPHSYHKSHYKKDDKDKWSLMGELVEQTCRDLEIKSPSLAVHLQKEINDTLFKYQLQMLGQR